MSWNRVVSLSSITDKKELVIKLLLESLVAVPYLPAKGTLLDIGSGAGIPGLIIKIARPEFHVHLLESRAKKVSFLKDTIRIFNLQGIDAYHGRAERYNDASGLLPSYDILTVRAVASLKRTLKICSPYLAPGSLLFTFKGPRIDKEMEESRDLMKKLVLSEKYKIRYELPEFNNTRYLIILKKNVLA